MNILMLFILMSFATYRGTRLLVRDEFPPIRFIRTQLAGNGQGMPARAWVPEWLSDLVGCHYCVSGYISLGTVIAIDQVAGLPLPVLWWFAIWGAGVLLLNYEARPDTPNWDRAQAVQDYMLQAINERNEIIGERNQEIAALKEEVALSRVVKAAKITKPPPS